MTGSQQNMSPEGRTQQLRKQELAIARKYAQRLPWEAVIWGIGNLLVWLSLWPLVFMGFVPLWLGFVIATFNVMLCYLPSHEAQHDIIGRRGTKWRWLNELVGHVSTIPLALPYRAAKLTHIQHHLHANDPHKDPDHSSLAPGPWQAIVKSMHNRQPGAKGGFNKYAVILQEIERPDVLIDGAIYQIAHFGILFGLALSGYVWEAVLLWWLPRQIGLTYIQFFLSWAPHHPGDGQGRYKDTRAFKSSWGNVGSMGMQYHIIHHLHPYIPLTDTPAAYREMRDILEQRGCRLEGI
ncbi:fatty acid desaturase [Parasphingorhabdus sp.]